MSDDTAPSIVELVGSDSPNGKIRVKLDIELPHAEAMGILAIVHDHKEKLAKAAQAEERRRDQERKKAEAAARKAAKAEAAKARKPSAAPAKAAAK